MSLLGQLGWHTSGVSRIVFKRGQNRDFGKKEGAKKNEKN